MEDGWEIHFHSVWEFDLSGQYNLAYLSMTVSKLLFLSAKPTILYHVYGARILLIVYLLDQLLHSTNRDLQRERPESEGMVKGLLFPVLLVVPINIVSTMASYPDKVSWFQFLASSSIFQD